MQDDCHMKQVKFAVLGNLSQILKFFDNMIVTTKSYYSCN